VREQEGVPKHRHDVIGTESTADVDTTSVGGTTASASPDVTAGPSTALTSADGHTHTAPDWVQNNVNTEWTDPPDYPNHFHTFDIAISGGTTGGTGNHTHNMNSHTHDLGAHTHTIAAHTHTGDHSHDVETTSRPDVNDANSPKHRHDVTANESTTSASVVTDGGGTTTAQSTEDSSEPTPNITLTDSSHTHTATWAPVYLFYSDEKEGHAHVLTISTGAVTSGTAETSHTHLMSSHVHTITHTHDVGHIHMMPEHAHGIETTARPEVLIHPHRHDVVATAASDATAIAASPELSDGSTAASGVPVPDEVEEASADHTHLFSYSIRKETSDYTATDGHDHWITVGFSDAASSGESGHTHTLNAHTHTLNNHSHSIGAHTHSLTHTHTFEVTTREEKVEV